MDFNPKEIFYSDSSYELPLWNDSDNPSYNANTGTLYRPEIDGAIYSDLVHQHEDKHRALGWLPTTCFQRVISRLLFKEFAKQKYQESSDISVLFPSNNPAIRVLKSIHEEIYRSNSSVQETIALGWTYSLYYSDDRIPVNSEERLEEAIKRADEGLPGFKSTCRTFCKSDWPREIYLLLQYIPLAPPFFDLQLPLTADGRLDGSRITNKKADRIVKNFRDSYTDLPYSPWKRFDVLISILEEMKEDGLSLNKKNFLQKINTHEALNIKEYSDYDYIHSYISCPYEDRFCPVDLLHSKGLKIPYKDFGVPNEHFGSETFKLLNCRFLNTPDGVKESECWYDGIQDDNELLTVATEVEIKNLKDRILIRINETTRSSGYFINWPLSAFLKASDVLKDIVFKYKNFAHRSSKIHLIDYFSPGNFKEDRWPDNAPELKELPFYKKLNDKQNLSPFISVESRKSDEFYGSEIYIS